MFRLLILLTSVLLCGKVAAADAPWRGEQPREWVFLDVGRVYDVKLADPRWPSFTADLAGASNSDFLSTPSRLGVGETIALVRGPLGDEWVGEFGLQPAIIGTLDLNKTSKAKYNSDWQFGVYAAVRRGRFSGLVRAHHVSGHIGDEFLVLFNGPFEDFSHESLDFLASYDLGSQFRVYGGGGIFFNVDPGDFENTYLQWGVEFYSSRTFAGGWARPVAGVDVRHLEGKNFQFDVSVVAGVQLQDPARTPGPRFFLLFKGYNGSDPNGAFWRENISTIGGGIRINL